MNQRGLIGPSPSPPINIWYIILIMVVCGLVVGLLVGVVQGALGIHLPGGSGS